MLLISGIALTVLSVAVFLFSLPRGGKTARFVGTEWEGYAVTMMIAALGIGVLMSIAGLTT